MGKKKDQNMDKVCNRLFVGDIVDALDYNLLKRNNITTTLNVSSLIHAYSHPDIRVLHFPLVDGDGNSEESLSRVVQTLEVLLEDGHTVLCHCFAGQSRSPTVIACFLARKDPRLTFQDAISFVRKVRDIAHPNKNLVRLATKFLNR